VKRYLLDTGIMGHFINRRRGVAERVRGARQTGAKIGTSMPMVGELFFGIEASQTRDTNHKLDASAGRN
jgi:predicted nucleic acid-binding protein